MNSSIACECDSFELVGGKCRVEDDIAEEVGGDSATAGRGEHVADLQPVFDIEGDLDGHDAVFLRRIAGPPEHVARPIAALGDGLNAQIFDMEGTAFASRVPGGESALGALAQPEFAQAVSAGGAGIGP